MTFKLQLGVRLHESLTGKRVLNPHHQLGRDIYPRLNNELCDQAHKRKTSRVLISGLEHNREDVLVQAKRQPYSQGIKELSPFQNKLTSANSRPEIVQDNFCEYAVGGRKNTYLDLSMSSLVTLWMSMKEVPELL
jgi:hypothetical protein